ncbi:immunoglobulin gamma-1 heavy chain-like [Aythya fuligula]|uniref:immunoglobulin gamma-1 heavy chain-like n=1 Tax=Aythya fuligula TaxID=219594 RepID=UPI001376215D|nr:immunoglobulin gamma-1 heavy chain-like [Aythya fuligula]
MFLWLLVITFAAATEGTLSNIKMVASGPKEGKVFGSLPLTCTIIGAPLDSPLYDWNYVRLAPTGELQFLAWVYPFGNNTGYAPPFKSRATISADKAKKKVSLQLHALTAIDTATYFCARQHTIKAMAVETDKLVFGSGIAFSVEPNRQEYSTPEVIALKSKVPKQYGSKLNIACLARTFYPKNISLDGPEGHIVYDLKAPLITLEGMYSTWKVIGVKPDAEGTCKAVHKRNETAASTILPEEKAEELVTVKVCNITDASTKDVKMEKMNMVFMVVLCLRVLLAKSIAFGTLMTIKLFIFEARPDHLRLYKKSSAGSFEWRKSGEKSRHVRTTKGESPNTTNLKKGKEKVLSEPAMG